MLNPTADPDDKEEKDEDLSSKSSDDNNYMELHVEKELKDKIEPIEERLSLRKEEIDKIVEWLSKLDDRLKNLDSHYDGVVRAILLKFGVKLRDINEVAILKEFARLAATEEIARQRIKRKNKRENSPNRAVSPDGVEKDENSNYMTKLAPMAVTRRQSIARRQMREMRDSKVNKDLSTMAATKFIGIRRNLQSEQPIEKVNKSIEKVVEQTNDS